MECEHAERRINTIAAHFPSANDSSAAASLLLPLNCSSSLSSAVKRYDNRVLFARQGSSNQSCFMRQASMDLAKPAQPGGAFSAYGNVDTYNALEPPLFSRPGKVVPTFNAIKSIEDDFRSPSAEPPKYARIPELDDQFGSKKQIPTSKPQNGLVLAGAEWSPRTNIAESECKYVISMELPGVDIGDIKVEVNAKSLIVMGRRSKTKWTALECCSSSNLSTTTYHKKEILLGPYHLMWPLPANVSKDGISAEFVEGILRISIPKI